MDVPPAKRLREDNNDDAGESAIVPSQVVYVKDLKDNVVEADFHDALSHFGPISYVMCMRDSCKALVEFENINSACECVNEAKITTIEIAGSPAIFQFSKASMIRRSGLESQSPSNVLVLSVYNVLYPITVDVVYQICSLYGRVLRVALMKGKENLEVQALVEFDSIDTAKRTKHAINGADIYAGCCTLKLEFSVLDRVNVVRNSHDQWDYTLQDAINKSSSTNDVLHKLDHSPGHPAVLSTPNVVPMGIVQPMHYMSMSVYSSTSSNLQRKRKIDKDAYLPINNGNLSKSPVLMVYGLDVDKFNCDRVFNLLCSYGDCMKVKFLRSMPGTCMTEMKNAEDAQIVIQHLRGVTIFEKDLEFTFSRNETLRNPMSEVYKLSDQTPSFKDYTNSRNLRFISPEIASKNKLVFPTKQLHFFNAPPTMTEERISKIFENHGIIPMEIIMSRKKTDRSSSGFVSFDSISQALAALVVCNHTPIKEPEVRNPYLFKLAFALEKEDSTVV